MIRPAKSQGTIRVANAAGFWGDQPGAVAQLLAAEPGLDFLTLDYLAEVSLSIMAGLRAKDARGGYAADFVAAVAALAPHWKRGGHLRVVTNAGGLNPSGCAEACREVLRAAGVRLLKIAVITGDDVLPLVGSQPEAFSEFEPGVALAPLASRLATANAYLGAKSIAEALRAGADLVITGRVADPSLTVGPCLAGFGWDDADWGRIAGATVAGHLIECGTQVCGGCSTDWMETPHPEAIGFPIAEIEADGSCVITKPRGTGGAVTVRTVKEQLLYEIGDPGRYLSPDATVSFLGLKAALAGPDRVRVTGATGGPPPATYKVSATYPDGFKAHGLLTLFGHTASAKAQRAGHALLNRLAAGGCVFRETLVESLGTGAAVLGVAGGEDASEHLEVVLRISVAADERAPVERFTREIASLVTAGPQGVTGYATGRPKVLPIFGYQPGLVRREAVVPQTSFVSS